MDGDSRTPTRNPHVVAAATDALPEMQAWREALEPSAEPLPVKVRRVMAAAVAFHVVALPIEALLVTDHQLGDQFHELARSHSVGPQVPIEETTTWIRGLQRAGQVDAGHDPRALAVLVCGAGRELATLRTILPHDLPPEVFSGVDDLLPAVMAMLTCAPAAIEPIDPDDT